jgi:hypothetical protein
MSNGIGQIVSIEKAMAEYDAMPPDLRKISRNLAHKWSDGMIFERVKRDGSASNVLRMIRRCEIELTAMTYGDNHPEADL